MNQKPGFQELVSLLPDLLAPNLAQDWPELPLERTEGVYLYAADGRKIMDFMSGFAVTNLGHNHPRVQAAAIAQIQQAMYAPVGVTVTEPLLRLALELRKSLPEGMETFFFGNSGAEAIEGALKMARYVTGRPAIISFFGGFHGRTYGAMSVTSIKSKYRAHYEPFVPGVYFAEYPYPFRCPFGSDDQAVIDWSIASIQQLFERLVPPSQVAAFLIEPVQGEGGYIVPPAGFWPALRQLCDQHGILLILDEVQTGFGRTGQMFAAQTFGIRPDVMAIGKAIANGLPMGAVVSSRDLMAKWAFGSHGTTFGGNPVCCAAALAVQQVFQEQDILGNGRLMGERLRAGMRRLQAGCPGIGEVRGVGLMAAMEFVIPGRGKEPDPLTANRVLTGCFERGLLGFIAGRYGQVIRFMPPLTITAEQADEALAILAESLNAAQ